MSIRIAPSILAADFSCLADEVKAVVAGGADWIHLDVMDGHFVPNLTFGPGLVKAIRPATDRFFDVHLMIEDPDFYAPLFAQAGADLITVHAEATRHLHRTLQAVAALGVKVGVSLNPHTPLSAIKHVLHMVDLVLVMTVNPGFGGQSFITEMLPKITSLRAMIDKCGHAVDIQVDGGIKPGSAFEAARAGATVFVAGSAVFKATDYGLAITGIREDAQRGFDEANSGGA